MTLNGVRASIPEAYADEPLLGLLRDHFGLRGPRFGCGVGSCGACTVVIDGASARACVTPAGSVADRAVLTLEGLASGADLHPIQKAWIDESVPQCGYCQNGQIMTAFALLAETPDADAETVAAAMDGVLCRCGTYQRIRRAIRRAQAAMAEAGR